MTEGRAFAEAMILGTTEQAVAAMQMQRLNLEMLMVGVVAKATADAYARHARMQAERRQAEAMRRAYEEQVAIYAARQKEALTWIIT
jgi:hypothetical protein